MNALKLPTNPANNQFVRVTLSDGEQYLARFYEQHYMFDNQPGYSLIIPGLGLWFRTPEQVQKWEPADETLQER